MDTDTKDEALEQDPFELAIFDFAVDGMDLISMLGDTISQATAFQRDLLEIIGLTTPDELKPRLNRLKRG
jgi:hypothetical protein